MIVSGMLFTNLAGFTQLNFSLELGFSKAYPPGRPNYEKNIQRIIMITPKLVVASLFALTLVGCATPTRMTDEQTISYDKDTDYAITPRPDGFSIAINYSRYQFIPESSAVATACKSALTAIAYEHADKQRLKIKPLNEQRIRISMGRNGLTGITSCSALAVAEWLT